MLLKLKSKYRKWRLLSLNPGTLIRGVFFYILAIAVGFMISTFLEDFQEAKLQSLVIQNASQSERIQEYQNRLQIKEQALTKLNDLNAELREKYRFLLGQLRMSVDWNNFEKPNASKNTKKNRNTSPILQHFSLIRLSSTHYQYRIFLINDQQSDRTRYMLSFKFENGEIEQLELNHREFSLPSSSKRIVLPFLGVIESRHRQLKVSTFLILDNDKEVFKATNKYEGN